MLLPPSLKCMQQQANRPLLFTISTQAYIIHTLSWHNCGTWSNANFILLFHCPLNMDSVDSSSLSSDEHLGRSHDFSAQATTSKFQKNSNVQSGNKRNSILVITLNVLAYASDVLLYAALLQGLGEGWPLFFFSTLCATAGQFLTPTRSK